MTPLLQPELHPDADQLNALMENALPLEERQQTLAHLAVCPDCRAVLSFAALAMPETTALAMPATTAPAPRRAPAGRVGAWRARLAGLGTGWRIAMPAMACALLLAFAAVRLHKGELLPGAGPATGVGIPTASVEPPPAPSSPASSATRAQDKASSPAAATALLKPVPAGSLPAPQAMPTERNRSVGNAAANETGASDGALHAAEGNVSPSAGASGKSAVAESRMAAAAPAPAPATAGTAMSIANGTTAAASPAPLAMAPARIAREALPSHRAVLSLTSAGDRVVAIDAGNELFFSGDRGAHWVAVRSPWAGRALRVEGGQDLATPAARQSFGFASAAAQPPAGPGIESKRALAAAQTSVGAAPAPVSPEPAPSAATPAVGLAGGSVRGKVVDAEGAVVPQATITLNSSGSAPLRTARTDGQGEFHLDGVAPGGYRVQAAAPGFMAGSLALEVKPGATTSAALTLPVGSASATVEVSSNAQATETEAAQTDALLPSLPRRQAVFTLTTDRGERWISADGVHWTKR